MSQNKAQVDKLLTGVSQKLEVRGTCADKILPVIKSKQYSGLLGKYGKSHLRLENTIKGGRGRYREVVSAATTTTQFLIEGHGLAGMVTKEDYANKELPFDAEADEVSHIESILILEKEKVLADSLRNEAIITQYVALTGTGKFSDYLNSDPIKIFSDARSAVIDGAGITVNKGIMDIKVYDKLRFHPQMLDALGYKDNRPGGLSRQELATALDLEELFITEARYNSAKEGQADVLAPIWGKDIILLHTPKSAAVRQMSLGYLVTPEGSSPRKVYKQANFNPPGSTQILCEDEYDMLISDANCAYLIKDAIA